MTEPDAYDDGELIVSDIDGTHEVKLPAGDLILYPAGSLHRMEPVTRGNRASSFFWVQIMVRIAEHRTILHGLDQCVKKLRLRLGGGRHRIEPDRATPQSAPTLGRCLNV